MEMHNRRIWKERSESGVQEKKDNKGRIETGIGERGGDISIKPKAAGGERSHGGEK